MRDRMSIMYFFRAVTAPEYLIKLGVLLLVVMIASARGELLAGQESWVATWGCAPQLVEPANRPPIPLANNTLREFVRVSIGGRRLRVRLSNRFGTDAVTLSAVHIAQAAGPGSAGNGDINPSTDTPLTFQGAAAITLPPGETVDSDSVDFELPALGNLAITIWFGEVSATNLTGHPGSRTTSFIRHGKAVANPSLPDAVKIAHWYFITGVEVLAGPASKTVVILGDSITDGRGSTTDGNNRWPDDLARRLQTNPPTAGVGVVNMGIGGNGIFGGLGPAGVKRFDRDVLEQSGVGWLILFEGVNDIGGDRSGTVATNLISAYTKFIKQAQAHSIATYGATITPFGGNRYFSISHEAARQAVNHWMRTNELADGVIDFDAVVRDPVTLTNLLRAYDSGDGLHLNPAGYKAMANAIPPGLFLTPTNFDVQQNRMDPSGSRH